MLIKYDPCRNGIKADARSCKILKDFYISKINPMCQNAKNSYFYTNKVFKSLFICRNIKNKDPRFATANTNILPLNKNPSESAQTLATVYQLSNTAHKAISSSLTCWWCLSPWCRQMIVSAPVTVACVTQTLCCSRHSGRPWSWWQHRCSFLLCRDDEVLLKCFATMIGCLWFKGGQDQATVL